MKATGIAMVLTVAACGALQAQRPAQPAPPPPVTVEGAPANRIRERDMVEAQRMRENAMMDERRVAGEPLERNLFPPELIMRRQRDIGLQPAQRQQITQAIGRLEASLVELQWSMQEQQQALAEMLAQPQVNTDAALQLLDRVLTTEAAVKRVHFQALLQIRNVLTPEQQDRLRGAMRSADQIREEER